jgi:hypothetical protein
MSDRAVALVQTAIGAEAGNGPLATALLELALESGLGGPPSGAAGGNLSGTYPNPIVVQINNTTVPATTGADIGKVLTVTAAGVASYSTPVGSGLFIVVPVPGGGAPFAVAPVTSQLIAVNSTGGAKSIVLPAAPPVGTAITVKDVGGVAEANPITIVGTIDGTVNYLQNVSYSSFTLVFTGASWSII